MVNSASLRDAANYYLAVAAKLSEAADMLDAYSPDPFMLPISALPLNLAPAPALSASVPAPVPTPKLSIKEALHEILKIKVQPRSLIELVNEVRLKTKENVNQDTVATILSREKALFLSYGRNKWGLKDWATKDPSRTA